MRLAERLNCKVWAAPMEGRPGFPETHRLYQGTLPGAIGPLCQKLESHDVIVVIGAPVFRYYPYVPGDYIPAGSRLFHITDDAAEAARAPVGTSVLADSGRACAVLSETVTASSREAPPPRAAADPPAAPTCFTNPLLTFGQATASSCRSRCRR